MAVKRMFDSEAKNTAFLLKKCAVGPILFPAALA
jgi:hypothetical protein